MADRGVLDRPSDDDRAARSGSPASTDAATDDVLSRRLALGVFVAYLVVAFFVLRSVGGNRYFVADDWDFVANRSLTNLGDVFRSHNGHWTTVPIVEYRLLYQWFGLDYTPYQAVGIAAHLATAGLLRTVMRRCGVGPWTATVFVGTLVLLGAGNDDFLSAFQIAFVGAVAFGLVQLLLLNHRGPIGRRDWLALLAGLAALMCSSVGVSMLAGVGVAVLLARGWRAALFAVGPLMAIFVLWYKTVGQVPPTGNGPGIARELGWIWASFSGAFVGLGQQPVVAVLLAALLVGGLAMAWWPLGGPARRWQASMPVGLLVSAIAFAASTGFSRWFLGTSTAAASRYVYVIAACLLVPLAVAGDTLIRRWPLATPVVLVVVLIGAPANIRALDDDPFAGVYASQRHLVAAIGRLPLARQVPGWGRVTPGVFSTGSLTIGQVVAALDAGHLPDPGPPAPISDAQLPLRVSLVQADTGSAGRCASHAEPLDLHLQRGDKFGIVATTSVVQLQDGVPTSLPVGFDPTYGKTLVAQVPALDIRVGLRSGQRTFTVCR